MSASLDSAETLSLPLFHLLPPFLLHVLLAIILHSQARDSGRTDCEKGSSGGDYVTYIEAFMVNVN